MAEKIRVAERIRKEFGDLLAKVIIRIIATEFNVRGIRQRRSLQPRLRRHRNNYDHRAKPMAISTDRLQAEAQPLKILPVAPDEQIAGRCHMSVNVLASDLAYARWEMSTNHASAPRIGGARILRTSDEGDLDQILRANIQAVIYSPVKLPGWLDAVASAVEEGF